jgi:chromosome segregation ATPase
MLKRIELINFMSHKHMVLDLAPGLSVLVGPNNCGKSAVVQNGNVGHHRFYRS